eukprot:TRINITY_DN907_c0_g2_i1.p1 TRINITY_DN907_c0_g2~~TRINITY_DN907_c0_g2_i1.p1  ORF type:complete len:182 (+),score=30.14 TRINITY_DN907_c0_g2_i1:752-1297(+)
MCVGCVWFALRKKKGKDPEAANRGEVVSEEVGGTTLNHQYYEYYSPRHVSEEPRRVSSKDGLVTENETVEKSSPPPPTPPPKKEPPPAPPAPPSPVIEVLEDRPPPTPPVTTNNPLSFEDNTYFSPHPYQPPVPYPPFPAEGSPYPVPQIVYSGDSGGRSYTPSPPGQLSPVQMQAIFMKI